MTPDVFRVLLEQSLEKLFGWRVAIYKKCGCGLENILGLKKWQKKN